MADNEIKAVFTCKGGYAGQRAEAMKVLTIGQEYTIIYADIGRCSTYVTLKEVRGQLFNSCLFDIDYGLLHDAFGDDGQL